MQINNSLSFQNCDSTRQTSFKSAYPVYYWIKEANGKYKPVQNIDTVRIMQEIFNNYINQSKKYFSNFNATKRLEVILHNIITTLTKDSDYKINSFKKRIFYNERGGNWLGEKFDPITYIITGKDSNKFCRKFCMPMGIADTNYSPESYSSIKEHEDAHFSYHILGLDYIRKLAKNFKNKDGISQGLHIKMLATKDEFGNINYALEDLKFLPDEGEKNPCTKWYKRFCE